MDITIRTLRNMAWERAKGELRSMTQTFWAGETTQYDKLRNAIDSFIKEVEDNGWHE